jgi:uncharacterized protein
VPPAPTGAVSDYAGLLSAADRARLDSLIRERNQATGAQMAVAIFPSLEGESLEDFSIRLAEQWRIGQKGLDNGVILVVFVADRKVRFEVGYGLEGSVTDAVTSAIIGRVLAPRFREGQYARGLEEAVAAVFQRVEATPADKRPGPRRTRGTHLPVIGFFALLGVIAFILWRDASSAVSSARRNAYTARGQGWYTPIIMPPGGGWGGGGWGGGSGGSGGGFSGGGGSFGGGGASGSW